MFMSMKSCQTQTDIHIDSQFTNDDSNEDVLKTLSNLLSTFGQKIFSSHLSEENSVIDSMLIDSQPLYILYHIQNIPYMS